MNYQPIKRFFILFISSLAILTTAQSCTGLNLGISNPLVAPTILGVLKHDPEIKSDGFGQINSVKTVSGGKDVQGLSNLSGNKISQVNKDTLFLLTKTKGLFKSTNGGRDWERKYIFNINSNEFDQNKKNQEITAKINQNDSFVPSDFIIDTQNEQNIFVAGKTNDKIGKIYSSNDGGDTFKLTYTEVQVDIGVNIITIDPANPLRVYALLEGGSLIRSLDAGSTWKKVQNFKETPVQVGFTQGIKPTLFVILRTVGVSISLNDGDSWETINTEKEPITEKSETKTEGASFISSNPKKNIFTLFDRFIPVSTPNGAIESAIMVADNQLWYSENISKLPFKKLLLPLQADQQNILDVAIDRAKGLDRIYVSVGNKLLETKNKGESWNSQDKIGLSSKIGNIGQILLDKDNSETIYLMLIDPKLKRTNGRFE